MDMMDMDMETIEVETMEMGMGMGIWRWGRGDGDMLEIIETTTYASSSSITRLLYNWRLSYSNWR